jgi:hypothetical protein
MSEPQRPDPNVVSDAIPLVFIGRNKDGFWVARDADTKVGGLFLSKFGAERFAHRRKRLFAAATMVLPQGLELIGKNRGNPLVDYIAVVKRVAVRGLSGLVAPACQAAAAMFTRLSRAHAEARIHRAAIERDLFRNQCRISTRSDDDLRIAP